MFTKAKPYSCPNIEKIELDNEISLTLDSVMLPWGDPSTSLGISDEIMLSPEILPGL